MSIKIRSVGMFLLIGALSLSMAMAAENKEKVKITGISKVWGNTEKNLTFMEGKLLIVQEETTIRTGYAEVDQDTKDAKFSKGVILTKKDLKIESQDLLLNFNKKIGTFLSQVRLERSETKNAEGKVAKEALTLTCERLEADTKRENFTAFGDVRIDHKEFKGSSSQMDFDNEKQLLILKGSAELTREQGEKLFGQSIRIDLEKKTFEIRDNASMEFNVDKEDDDNGENGKNKGQQQPSQDGTKTPNEEGKANNGEAKE